MHPVLLCYDGSAEARRAIQTAGHLLCERPAIVLHVSKSKIDWGLGPSLGPLLEIPTVDAAILAKAQSVLDEGLRIAGLAGFLATGELHTTGSAVWHTVLEVADHHDAQVIVAGSHGHRLRNPLALGSVAHGLVAHSDTPLLITHRNDVTSLERLRQTNHARLLVAYDGSDAADAAIGAVCSLFPRAGVRILSAWETPAYWDAAFGTNGLVDPILDREAELQHAALVVADRGAAVARELGIDASPLPVPATHGIGRTIVDTARDLDFDAIAVGSHGHSGISRAVLGTTAHYVVQHADRPVLVVPAASHIELASMFADRRALTATGV